MAACYYLPVLHQPSNSCSSLIAPLLCADKAVLDHLRAAVQELVDHIGLDLPMSSAADLLTFVLAVVAAMSEVEQDDCLSEREDAEGGLVACGLLTSSMCVPLLRKASRLMDADLSDRLVEATGVLTAQLSGHGEHTMRIGLGDARAPLRLRCVPQGWCTGTRLWPAARLAIGACTAGWERLDVRGASVVEIGCGTAACGLACAALGASTVWLTDWDDDALSIARRNAEHNGLGAQCQTAKLDFMQGFPDASARPAGMPRTFDLVLAADVLYDWSGSWRETLEAVASYLDLSNRGARALCVFGQQKRSEAARAACDEFDQAVRRGAAGLRLIASEDVTEEGHEEEGIRMLLLAPAEDDVATDNY